MKKYLVASSLIAALATSAAFAADRDPFSPSGGAAGKSTTVIAPTDSKKIANVGDEGLDNNPITATQLNSFKVIGVMVSDNMKIASVKAINNTNYLVKVGDSIGSEGGKVSAITTEGLTVQTESQEVKIPVSNKIEVPVENSQSK